MGGGEGEEREGRRGKGKKRGSEGRGKEKGVKRRGGDGGGALKENHASGSALFPP